MLFAKGRLPLQLTRSWQAFLFRLLTKLYPKCTNMTVNHFSLSDDWLCEKQNGIRLVLWSTFVEENPQALSLFRISMNNTERNKQKLTEKTLLSLRRILVNVTHFINFCFLNWRWTFLFHNPFSGISLIKEKITTLGRLKSEDDDAEKGDVKPEKAEKTVKGVKENKSRSHLQVAGQDKPWKSWMWSNKPGFIGQIIVCLLGRRLE